MQHVSEPKTLLSNLLTHHTEINWMTLDQYAQIKSSADFNSQKKLFISLLQSTCAYSERLIREVLAHRELGQLLNQHFYCIAIDREIRTDLDLSIQHLLYKAQGMSGFPVLIFCQNDFSPLFISMALPLHSDVENKVIGLLDLTRDMIAHMDHIDPELLEEAKKLWARCLERTPTTEHLKIEGHFPHPEGILNAIKHLRDEEFGGFYFNAKFPQFAFYQWAIEQMMEGVIQKEQGAFIIKSIDAMLYSALNDHLKGGFHRYTLDRQGLRPAFEKMLYDQAGLLSLLARLGNIYQHPLVFDTLFLTLNYLETEMLGEEKIFFSSQSGVSEGVEGLYFTFLKSEFEDALNHFDDEQENLQKNAEQILKWFQISSQGHLQSGLNVISLDQKYAAEFLTENGWELVRLAKKALLKMRHQRIPGPSQKIGTAHTNFMLLHSLIDVQRFCPIKPIAQLAEKILAENFVANISMFVQKNERGELRLIHAPEVLSKSAEAFSMAPFFDDFVFLAECFYDLYELKGEAEHLENFKNIMYYCRDHFYHDERFYIHPVKDQKAMHFCDHLNLEVSLFDQNYKSAIGTFLILSKKMQAHLSHRHFETSEQQQAAIASFEYSSFKFYAAQEILKNAPMSAGQLLRALTYPLEAYIVLKIPRSFLSHPEFKAYQTFFLHRFTLLYTDDQTDQNTPPHKWELYRLGVVENSGDSFESFQQFLGKK